MLALYTLLQGAGQPARMGGAAGSDVLVGRLRGSLATQAAQGEPVGGQTEAGKDAGTAKPEAQRSPESEPVVWSASDPFVRDWLLINELAELNLKAITMGGNKAYVLINDQILESGDVISGKRIVRIESDKVLLEQGGRTFTLMLGE
ncbi:MAG: hypothetical protein R6X12_04405 [bacterium]